MWDLLEEKCSETSFLRILRSSPVHIIRPVLDMQQSGGGQKMYASEAVIKQKYSHTLPQRINTNFRTGHHDACLSLRTWYSRISGREHQAKKLYRLGRYDTKFLFPLEQQNSCYRVVRNMRVRWPAFSLASHCVTAQQEVTHKDAACQIFLFIVKCKFSIYFYFLYLVAGTVQLV
jgi:hypothetical protein